MLTARELKDTLDYDRKSGVFTWRVSNSNRAKIGAVAGCGSGIYRYIRLNKQNFLAHRLAWLYVYGRFPKEQIDHINGKKQDNRIENLREASPSQNGMNRGAQINNKAGMKGVYWHRRDRRWYTFIKCNKKKYYLGLFESSEAAHAAYQRAAQQLHGEFAEDWAWLRGQG